jgi:hypothetical protein
VGVDHTQVDVGRLPVEQNPQGRAGFLVQHDRPGIGVLSGAGRHGVCLRRAKPVGICSATRRTVEPQSAPIIAPTATSDG